jgi:hypothetical protein
VIRDRLRLVFELVGDRARQDVEEQVLGLRLFQPERRERSAALGGERPRGSVNTMVPPTAMFSASIVLVNQTGSGSQTGPMISPASPDPRNTTRYATYQRPQT